MKLLTHIWFGLFWISLIGALTIHGDIFLTAIIVWFAASIATGLITSIIYFSDVWRAINNIFLIVYASIWAVIIIAYAFCSKRKSAIRKNA